MAGTSPAMTMRIGRVQRPQVSPQRRDARLGNLLVLVRLDAGDADRADAFVLVHDRQAALDQDAGGKGREGRPLLYPVLEEFARPLGERGGARLAPPDPGGKWRGAVHALQLQQGTAPVDG